MHNIPPRGHVGMELSHMLHRTTSEASLYDNKSSSVCCQSVHMVCTCPQRTMRQSHQLAVAVVYLNYCTRDISTVPRHLRINPIHEWLFLHNIKLYHHKHPLIWHACSDGPWTILQSLTVERGTCERVSGSWVFNHSLYCNVKPNSISC
jgi:hypothetical protein